MLAAIVCASCTKTDEYDIQGQSIDKMSTEEFSLFINELVCKCDKCFFKRLEEINIVLEQRAHERSQAQKPKVLVKRSG